MTMYFDTQSFDAVRKKRRKFRMNEVSFDGIRSNLTRMPMHHFKTIFYQTRSRILTRMNSTSNFSSRFSPSEHAYES